MCKDEDPEEVDLTDRSRLGKAAWLAQAVGGPVPLFKKSFGYVSETHPSARVNSSSGTPGSCWNMELRKADVANEPFEASQEMEVASVASRTVGEAVPLCYLGHM